MGALLSSGVERISSHSSSIVNWVTPLTVPGTAALEALAAGCKTPRLAPADPMSPFAPTLEAGTFGEAVWYMLVASDIDDARASAVSTIGRGAQAGKRRTSGGLTEPAASCGVGCAYSYEC